VHVDLQDEGLNPVSLHHGAKFQATITSLQSLICTKHNAVTKTSLAEFCGRTKREEMSTYRHFGMYMLCACLDSKCNEGQYKVKEDEMGRACSTNGGDEERI
jgi:hypothetical protein